MFFSDKTSQSQFVKEDGGPEGEFLETVDAVLSQIVCYSASKLACRSKSALMPVSEVMLLEDILVPINNAEYELAGVDVLHSGCNQFRVSNKDEWTIRHTADERCSMRESCLFTTERCMLCF